MIPHLDRKSISKLETFIAIVQLSESIETGFFGVFYIEKLSVFLGIIVFFRVLVLFAKYFRFIWSRVAADLDIIANLM